uniref:Myb-like domain-containing protein n=1 Tax=Setaria viridis TaxID=4556 RepID=A0A4U6UXL5_SETVI|nr:hypothetical protein SEVIR_4G160200v2 [Setaria viridis]
MLSVSTRKSKLVGASKKSKVASAAATVTAAAPTHTSGHGSGSMTAARTLGCGGGLASGADSAGRTLGRGSRSASVAVASRPIFGGLGYSAAMAPSSIDGSGGAAFLGPATTPSLDAWFDAAGSDPSSPVSCPLNRPLSTNNDASSPPEVEILLDNDNVRTEKRILWTEEEDLRLMSAWIEHSTDSTCGADKGGNQYWGEVVESYNKTTPPLRKRNLKQCKDRWHKINRWTDLFECAYVKARRVFTSGYSDQIWIDAAHKFYVEDNKDAKLGPFVGIEVWKICREVSKWKTYNEELRNARKRNLEEERDQENDESLEEMPNRPMGQKAAKKAALAAKGKSKGSSSEDDGNSKESAIDLDKLETKEGKKLEKESKMMEAYNSLILQDTSSMSDVEKADELLP